MPPEPAPREALPCGTWPSPVGADLAAAHDGRPEYLGAVGEELWWTAPRPAEGGRRALLRLRPGEDEAESVLPPPWNVRNRVIEYGGLPWAGAPREHGGPLIVFTHAADQRLYACTPDDPGSPLPRPLTPPPPSPEETASGSATLHWCDPVVHPEQGEVWCVLEEHTGEGAAARVRRVPAAVPLDGSAAADRSALRELTGDGQSGARDAGHGGGHRFVTGPRLSPDGRHAAWLAWDHPRMPWDGTELKLADVTADHRLTRVRTLAGGPEEALAQAEWAPDGSLLVTSDRTGWWNPYRIDPVTGRALPLHPAEEEHAEGLWRIGHRWLAPLGDGLLAVLHGRGALRLGVLDPATGELADAPGPWTEWSPSLAVRGTRVAGIAAGPRRGYEIVELDTATGLCRVLAGKHRDAVDPAYLPEPQPRTVPGPGGREVHATLYPPAHPAARPDGELPPWVLWAHGGPTSRAPAVLDLEIAYFTSRGIGVAEVNYGGSTGYGRAYRNRLRGQWGVVDVEDCAAVARALAAEGLADPARLALRGGSAGGWTTAASLTSPDTADLYRCGVILYPVLDLEHWTVGGTHDFESHYLESLIGPRAEAPERYRERSPLHHADRLAVPFLLLQGLDDVICPPEQSERLLSAVAGRGIPHACLTFPGEGHGFRRAETIERVLEAELALYLQVFGVDRPDAPELELHT